MPIEPLANIPDGSNVFLDANVFIYGLSGASAQCKVLLERCAKEDITGVTLFEIINEATHQFMVAEAFSKRLISSRTAKALRSKHDIIPDLIDYWVNTERILALNLLFLSTEESTLKNAQEVRHAASLLTNDSMIVSCMREYGISQLASADGDFKRVHDIVVYSPDDLSAPTPLR